jgi:rod shape-determining protein MreD
MRTVPYILYLLLIAMHQVVWRDVTSIFGVMINLAALMVVLVALYKTEMIAVWFGFLVGIVLGAGNPAMIGWHAFALSVLGLVAFHISERLNLESLFARMLLVFGTVFIHNLLKLLIDQTDGLFYLFWTSVITGAVYTTVLALLFFSVKERKITVQRLKAFF